MHRPTGNQGPAFLDSWQLRGWPLRHSLLWEVLLGTHPEVSTLPPLHWEMESSRIPDYTSDTWESWLVAGLWGPGIIYTEIVTLAIDS